MHYMCLPAQQWSRSAAVSHGIEEQLLELRKELYTYASPQKPATCATDEHLALAAWWWGWNQIQTQKK